MNRRATDRPPEGFSALPLPARMFMVGLFSLTAGGLAAALTVGWGPPLEPGLLALLVVLAAAGAAFETFAPGHYSLQPNYAFLFWAAVVLPPWGVVAVAVACFLPSWLARRAAAYKTAFNIADFALTGFLVSGIAAVTSLNQAPADLGPAGVAALIAAAVVGAVVNHALIVVVVTLAGEQRLRRALPQLAEGLPISVGVGLTGACLLLLWGTSPWLVLAGVGPVALVYRSLWVPMLKHRADTDAKTGLYNLARFREEFERLLADARRRRESVAVAMLDLDHLRMINNQAGHLAGDRAIRAVAEALTELSSRAGLAARFGGEEFTVVLGGWGVEDARTALEAILEQLGEIDFRAEDAPHPLRVSFSAGIAAFPAHGSTVEDLLNAADAACYAAKAAGRACVRVAAAPAAVPHAA